MDILEHRIEMNKDETLDKPKNFTQNVFRELFLSANFDIFE